MSDNHNNILSGMPKELQDQFLSFLREGADGNWRCVDKAALLDFVIEHGKTYPALYAFFNIDEAAIAKYFEEKRK